MHRYSQGGSEGSTLTWSQCTVSEAKRKGPRKQPLPLLKPLSPTSRRNLWMSPPDPGLSEKKYSKAPLLSLSTHLDGLNSRIHCFANCATLSRLLASAMMPCSHHLFCGVLETGLLRGTLLAKQEILFSHHLTSLSGQMAPRHFHETRRCAQRVAIAIMPVPGQDWGLVPPCSP